MDTCPLDGLEVADLEDHITRAHQMTLIDIDDLEQRKAKALRDLAESIVNRSGMTAEDGHDGLKIVRNVPTGGYL